VAKSSTDVIGVTLDSLGRRNLIVHFSLNVCALRTFLVSASAFERTLEFRFIILLLFYCLASGKHQFAEEKNIKEEKKTEVTGIPASAEERDEFSSWTARV
jgi:hypothetical protein